MVKGSYNNIINMIYQPHMEKSDWSEFTTMVQLTLKHQRPT